MAQVWGAIVLLLVCPLLGGLPLIGWIVRWLAGRHLAQLGTGNVSVSAAFYHGGTPVGLLAVASEAFKGIAAVLLARTLLPGQPSWEIVALLALVAGRYRMGRGAGTTNVVWGYVVHDWRVATLTFLLGGIGFTLFRERQRGRISVLFLFPALTALFHPNEPERFLASMCLAALMGWIYRHIPDDLDLTPDSAATGSQTMFRFFRGEKAIVPLAKPLTAQRVGQKAATLSQLLRWGYPIPTGWVLPPGDDPAPLIAFLQPSPDIPLVVRSSALGEDSETASAAGQYDSILNVTSRAKLQTAISQCLASYNNPNAVQYRHDRGLPETAMAVLIQRQVEGVFSGVAFSRDPIARQGDAVIIEALPGGAAQIVGGRVTPEQYQVIAPTLDQAQSTHWDLPQDLILEVQGTGTVPSALLQQVAYLARHLEARFYGVPQDIEWSYDGQSLWLLQCRPITTLVPIWTRKIAAEVIPGLIRPLTWSINRPLTCGVWGELFTIVLGQRAQGLDFTETATLHYSRSYFNATLLGEIFQRMGLPTESLEFLTRGAKFSRPPLGSTLRNLPGLLRLVQQEMRLPRDFQRDYRQSFEPTLVALAEQSTAELSAEQLLQRIDLILTTLQRATYYSILAPLSTALRQGISRVQDDALDNGQTPEVAALRSLQRLADQARATITMTPLSFETLGRSPEGQAILSEFDRIVGQFGYLSEVGTDIAVPTWKEHPHSVEELFSQLLTQPGLAQRPPKVQSRQVARVQQRLDLKGKVTEVYSRLLAELRWSFVALERLWLTDGILQATGEIFFLEFAEIRQLVEADQPQQKQQIAQWIASRQQQRDADQQLTPIPYLVYGNDPPPPLYPLSNLQSQQQIRGIGASPGVIEGTIKVLEQLKNLPDLDRNTILVVPYTDSGWAALLARAGGLIAEVGGRLSHGAIVAREYGIPAVMDIPNATQRFRDGQRVRLDGQRGIIEIL